MSCWIVSIAVFKFFLCSVYTVVKTIQCIFYLRCWTFHLYIFNLGLLKVFPMSLLSMFNLSSNFFNIWNIVIITFNVLFY